MKNLIALLICLIFIVANSLVLNVDQANAQSVVFQDDFSKDLEKWQPVRDAGQYWQIKDGRVEVTVPIPSTITELVPKDHFWDSRWHKIIYEFDFTPIAGVDRNISFGIQDSCNWYETHFVDGVANLVRLLQCQVSFGAQQQVSLNQHQTYHFKITLNENMIFIQIDGQLLFEETDWTFNQNFGKVGLKAGTGSVFPTTVAYDNVKVTLLDESLGIPLLKQTDPRWSEAEYDTAHKWATDVSIRRWGCALVSMVMILQHHGIVSFANGTPITPLTLNAWLLTQPDGYLGKGIFNWLAVTRLTRELNQVWHTPKLEYSATKAHQFEHAVTEITDQRPVVLQIDGHFLVADGVNQLGTDVLIKDPAYTYTHFSQHQAELVSVRSFHPSYTDLSYFMLAHAPNLEVTISSRTGISPPGLLNLVEKISDVVTPHQQTSLSQLLLPKPASDQYQLSISQADLGPFQIDLFVYDQQGTPTIFNLTGVVGPEAKTYQLEYTVGVKPTVTSITTWHQLRKDLFMIRQQEGFWGWPVFWILEWSLYQAETKQLPYQPEFIRALALQLSLYRPWMTELSYRYLAQEMNSLGD